MSVDDGQHHDVVEHGTDDRSNHLRAEDDPGGDLAVNTKFEIGEQRDGLNLNVVSQHGGVHVSDRVSLDDESSEHLVETSTSRNELSETKDGCQKSVCDGEDESEAGTDQDHPPRETGLASIGGGNGHSECGNEDKVVPPVRDGLVVSFLNEVVLVLNVRDIFIRQTKEQDSPTASETLLQSMEFKTSQCRLDVVPVEECDVNEGGTDRKVIDDQEERVGGREIGGADGLVL